MGVRFLDSVGVGDQKSRERRGGGATVTVRVEGSRGQLVPGVTNPGTSYVGSEKYTVRSEVSHRVKLEIRGRERSQSGQGRDGGLPWCECGKIPPVGEVSREDVPCRATGRTVPDTRHVVRRNPKRSTSALTPIFHPAKSI